MCVTFFIIIPLIPESVCLELLPGIMWSLKKVGNRCSRGDVIHTTGYWGLLACSPHLLSS